MFNKKRFPEDPYHLYEITYENNLQYCYCRNTDANGLQCNFKKRIDHLSNQLKKGIIHKCQYTKVRASATLDNFLKPSSSSEIKIEDIYEKIAYLIGKKIYLWIFVVHKNYQN